VRRKRRGGFKFRAHCDALRDAGRGFVSRTVVQDLVYLRGDQVRFLVDLAHVERVLERAPPLQEQGQPPENVTALPHQRGNRLDFLGGIFI
jgi:hypothetical protein